MRILILLRYEYFKHTAASNVLLQIYSLKVRYVTVHKYIVARFHFS